jgi:hypothetical protein
VRPVFDVVWTTKISPFGIGRFMGETQMKGLIERYVAQKQGESTSEDEKQAISDYMYQTMMRSGTTEQAIFLLFNPDLHAFLPLGHESKLGSQDFSVPVSFFYGENDWVLFVEENAG